MSSVEALRAKIDVLERESSQHTLERSKWDNERATLKHQLEDAKKAEQQAKAEVSKKIEQLQRQSAEDADRFQKERDRIQRQTQQLVDDAHQQLNDIEMSNNRLQSRVAQLTRELSAKDEELHSALKKNSDQKENLERIIKELVDKHKRTEDEHRRRFANAEEEIRQLLDEHRRQAADTVEARRQQALLRDEINELEAQIDNAKAINQDLLRDIESLRRRNEAAEEHMREAERYQRAEAEARNDLDVLVAKLEKADSHIQKLSDEAAAHHVTVVKLRHQAELAEDASHTARREKQEFHSRVAQLLESIAEETDRLVIEVDGTVESLQTLVSVGTGNNSHTAGRRALKARFGSTLRSDGDANSEQGILATAMQVRDALSMSREDIIVVQRGIVEEAIHKRDVGQKDAVVEEMLRSERAHIIELSAKNAELESQLVGEHSRATELERSLEETSRWMAEAVALGDERTQRMESVLEEKRQLTEKIGLLEDKLDAMEHTIQQHKNRAANLEAELSHTKERLRGQQLNQSSQDDHTASLQRTIAGLRAEIETLQAALEQARNEQAAAKQRASTVETELTFSRRQVEEHVNRARTRDQQIEQLERAVNHHKDQVYSLQARLDQALRANSGLGGTSGADVFSAAAEDTARKSLQFGARTVSPMRSLGSPRPADQTISADQSVSRSGSTSVKDWEARIQSILHRASS